MPDPKYARIHAVHDVYAYVDRNDIRKAERAIAGIVPDMHRQEYAIDALLQLGFSRLQNVQYPRPLSEYVSNITIHESNWQKAFAESIGEENANRPMQEWIPPHANLALLNHVKSAFGIPCIEFAGKAEEDYGRWKEASYTPVLTQEERPDQKEILHQYMLDAANGSMPKEVLLYLLAKDSMETMENDDPAMQEALGKIKNDAISASEKAVMEVLDSESPIGEHGLTILNIGFKANHESVIHYPAASVLMGLPGNLLNYRLYREKENREHLVLAYGKPESKDFVCISHGESYTHRSGDFLVRYAPVPTDEAFCLLKKDFGYEKSDFMENETVFAGTEPTHQEKDDAINHSLKMD